MAGVVRSEDLVDEASDFGALRPGTRLGRYELLVPIARGGMARVWAARLHGQRGFQKLVAIKTILPHLAREPEFERMFLDEARIASGVHHPNVCEIYELGEEQQTLYLAMEWIGGDSFARVLRPNGVTEAIDPRTAARLVADACAGLHAAHELTDEASGRPLGVVHRDLSPHNILLTADGVAKVADFGVAKALGQLHEATSAGQLKGKISYMAPEQVTGAPVDRRSDVFSMGVVLYEATTGNKPFRGEGDHQIMHALLKGEVVPPGAIVRGYPPELERIVLRALAPQPILRFDTAERMRFALEEFLARSGMLVTQSQVAQVVRARIGEHIDRRKERIRAASSAGDAGWTDVGNPNHTPSHHAQSGVKPAVPFNATLPLDQAKVGVPASAAPQTPKLPQPATRPLATTMLMGDAPGPVPAVAPATSERSHHGFTPSHSLPGAMPIGSFAPTSGSPVMTTLPPPSSARQPFEAPWAQPGGDRPSQAPAGAGQYAIAVGVGLLVAALIGTAGFFVWRSRHAAPPAVVATTAQPVPMPMPVASASAPPSASPEIALVVTPPEASLTLDGAELASEKRTIGRPPPGKTLMLVVRAKGYEDVTVLVDYFTPTPMELSLKPSGVADNGAKPDTKTDPKPETRAETKSDTKSKPKPRPTGDPSLPANPY